MSGAHSAAPSAAVPVSPADDWSGIEPAAIRAARRGEFWPQVEATAARGLLLIWGVLLALSLVLEIWLGWATLLAINRSFELLWGASVLLSGVGAWLAFRFSGDLGGEIDDLQDVTAP